MSRYSRNKKALRQIEGRHSVIETLLSNKKVSYIDISESNEVGPQIEKIVSIANEKKIKVNFISKKNIEKKSSTKKSQGVILYLDDNYQSSVEEMIFLADRKNEVPLIIFLDRVQDPHNLGAIARTAEIFGAHGIVVPSRNSAKNFSWCIRASAGALEHIEFSIVNSISKTLHYLQNMNFNIISLDMSGENIQDTKIDPLKPIALVVGSEHDGISEDVLKISNNIVSIPMKGEVSSLNVSVATGITLYTIFLKRN